MEVPLKNKKKLPYNPAIPFLGIYLEEMKSLIQKDPFSPNVHSSVCMLNRFRYPTMCDPMDYSPPGSSVHGIIQARILE